MAQFNGMIVTNKGRELLSRATAAKGKFIITAAVLGDGAYSGNLRECEELVNKKLDLILIGVYSEKGSTKVTVGITNKNVSESFRTNEIGVYARLEGDTKAILYAYDVAVEADTVPNNSLGTTLELVYDIYFDVSSEVEVILEITDSIAFLTQDIAKREFLKTYIVSGGDLKGKIQLEAGKQYLADDGKWYKNIGGDRVWEKSGVPDELLIEISWKTIMDEIAKKENTIDKKTGFNLDKTNSYELDDINQLVTAKALYNFNQKTKTDYEPKITIKNTGFNLNKTDNFNESNTNKLASAKALNDAYSLILGNNFGGYIQTVGLKQKGKIYISTTSNSLFICTADTSITYVDYNYFAGSSLVDILRTTFSQAKTVLTPTQGFSVTYRQIRGQLASIIFQNLITANSSGVEYFLPFPINAIASATATSASTNKYIKLVASTENTFKLFCDTPVSDVQVQLMVYAKNALIDW